MEKLTGTFLGRPIVVDEEKPPVNSDMAFGSWIEHRKCKVTKADDGVLEIQLEGQKDERAK